MLGGMQLAVDGEDVDLSKTVGYKGMMFSGVPNLALAIGYTNASWTLKCDLVARVRLPAAQPHGRARLRSSARRARPTRRVAVEPFIDLTSGYVLRAHRRASQAGRAQARGGCYQNYPRDILMLRRGRLKDEGIEFSRAGRGAAAPAARIAA